MGAISRLNMLLNIAMCVCVFCAKHWTFLASKSYVSRMMGSSGMTAHKHFVFLSHLGYEPFHSLTKYFSAHW